MGCDYFRADPIRVMAQKTVRPAHHRGTCSRRFRNCESGRIGAAAEIPAQQRADREAHFRGAASSRVAAAAGAGALGRTRAPEGIPALSEGLRDGDQETRLAALRGLGRTACPEAGEEILAWAGEAGLVVPPLPLQSALIQCCAERPSILLPYLKHAEGQVREVLARVLGEVATSSLGEELLPFADDSLDELRAAAARALSHAKPGLALDVLVELARDRVWFVRLRAIVSLGKLRRSEAI